MMSRLSWPDHGQPFAPHTRVDAVLQYVAGFALPWVWWARAQCVTSWALCAAFTCCLALGVEVPLGDTRGAARERALSELQLQLRQARQAEHALPALRASVRALGESARPGFLPDSRTLLAAIAGAVERSGSKLDRFEPQAPSAVDDENGRPLAAQAQIHLRATGAFSHLVDLAGALAALSLPLISDDAHVFRTADGDETLDASLTVIGGVPLPASNVHAEVSTVAVPLPLPPRPASAMLDPFTPDARLLASPPGNPAARAAATPAGHFRLGSRAATLLHDDLGWHLVPDAARRSGPA